MKLIDWIKAYEEDFAGFSNVENQLYAPLLTKILESGESLSVEEIKELHVSLQSIEQFINTWNQRKLKLGQLYDYAVLKRKLLESGVSSEDTLLSINDYYAQDTRFLSIVENTFKENIRLRDYMFGFPANMAEDSYIIKYIKEYENKLFLMNNCGDPKESGFYRMDSKKIENEIIDLFAEKFGLYNKEEYWGYVTSGGTEGNHFGIKQGFSFFTFDGTQKGILYFSKAAHYSIKKYVTMQPPVEDGTAKDVADKDSPIFNYEIVDVNLDNSIKIDDLIERVKRNWENNKQPAIIALTWGTTTYGACDNSKIIHDELTKLNIDHYIHLDAAMFGGIPNNQIDAPVLTDFLDSGADSISISLHKYLGMSMVNGVVIADRRPKKYSIYNNKPLIVSNQKIDYIGQHDSTILGSRDFMPFSTYQRCSEVLDRSLPNEYNDNILYFKNELKKYSINYYCGEKSNTFVLNKPSKELCEKYQLSSFIVDNDGVKEEKIHIIIFPSHKKEIISELVKDLSNCK